MPEGHPHEVNKGRDCEAMNPTVRIQLSVMMFIQFFIWGAWFVTMVTYLSALDFPPTAIGRAYSTTAWAAIISPFFVGMIADKFFSTEKILGVLHLLGGVVMYFASTIVDPVKFFWVLLLYTICYMPTLALVNSISFDQMQDPGKEFPSIRVLGTIGWIVAGWMISFFELLGAENIEATAWPLKMAAIASLVMGVYCFTLPHTPPKSANKKVTVSDVLGLEALKLMRERSFVVFIISSLLICIPLSFYYAFANGFFNEVGMEKVAFKMSFGQVSEIVFMLVMPFFFIRLGVKKMLLIGMLAWVVRYILFAYGNVDSMVWMFYAGILLHGICYDFFFVTGFIYVDRKAPIHIRASAQGFLTFVTLGVGMVIGANFSGYIVQLFTEQLADGGTVTHWTNIWLVPAVMAAVVMVAFALLFRDDVRTAEPITEAVEATGDQAEAGAASLPQ
jgi:nucleoside transporter